MKKAKDQELIKTIPDGVYECGITEHKKGKHLNDLTTDAQGNGYPVAGPDRQSEKENLRSGDAIPRR